MAADQLINVTRLSDSASLDIAVGNIIYFTGISSNADTVLTVLTDNDTVENVTIDETPTQVMGLSDDLLQFTEQDTSDTIGINALRVERDFVSGTGTEFQYNVNYATWERRKVTTAQSSFRDAINTAIVGNISGAALGTAATGVTQTQSGTGRDVVVELSFTDLEVGTPPAAGANAENVLLYTFPAGAHEHTTTYMSVGLEIGGVTTDTPDIGVGSVGATGAVSTLGGTATFEDYITGQTAADTNGTATTILAAATAGPLTGISINNASDTKTLYLNVADTWDAGITGALTATGTVRIHYLLMS